VVGVLRRRRAQRLSSCLPSSSVILLRRTPQIVLAMLFDARIMLQT
jgi:hypothetical protein